MLNDILILDQQWLPNQSDFPSISWPLYRAWPSTIIRGFHGAFATGVAFQQGTLTLPDTWFRPPLWDLLVFKLLRPDSSSLPCLNSTFHLEYPLVLSWLCSMLTGCKYMSLLQDYEIHFIFIINGTLICCKRIGKNQFCITVYLFVAEKYKKRFLLRCIHHFKSDLINNMDHMCISGTEPCKCQCFQFIIILFKFLGFLLWLFSIKLSLRILFHVFLELWDLFSIWNVPPHG